MGKWKNTLLASGVAIAIVVAILLSRNGFRLHTIKKTLLTKPAEHIAKPTGSKSAIPPRLGGQVSLKNKSKEEAINEYLERRREDRSFDWRVPIKFYGRVVDEASRPIAHSTIAFQWSDLSANGASEAKTASDERGLFSLTSVQGKGLTVKVSKDGYYSTPASRGDFEFANPAESTYYEPDSDHPVLFQLRKKGQGAELLKKSVEVVLPGDGSSKPIELTTGKAQPTGRLQVQSWKPWPPRPMSPHYDWKVTLTIPDGGFVEAHEEFAFEAPETVYEPAFEINMPASLGDAWKVSAEKTLYFTYGNPKKYGRLNLRTDGNSRYVFIDYVLNPSGSRNLEEASTAATNAH